jgi:photosystem II stability/assembly factor-like uncharacterized protein
VPTDIGKAAFVYCNEMRPALLALVLALSDTPARDHPVLRDWVPIGPGAAAVSEIVADPRPSGVVYAIAGDLLWRTGNGGKSWTRVAALSSLHFHSLAIDPSAPDTLYVTTSDNLHRSDDGGESWTPRGVGLPQGAAGGTAVSAARPSRLYAMDLRRLFRTDDRADHWEELPAGPWSPSATLYWVRPDPLQANTVYVGVEGQRIFRSRDAGLHWAPIGLGLPADIPAIVINPANSRVMYTTGFKSSDGGERWLPLPVFGQPTAIDPASPDTVFVATQDAGLHRSTDAGMTWDIVGNGLPTRGLQALTFSSADASTVYAGGLLDGVLRSEDGGESWVPANGGFPAVVVLSLAIDPSGGWLYSGSGSRGEARVFRRSVDGGEWLQTASPDIGGLWPSTFVSLDAAYPDVLYASGGTCTTHPPGCSGGVRRTRDGGATWESLSDQVIGAIVADRGNPDRLYSVKSTVKPNPGFPSIGEVVRTSVRSLDGGETWLDMDVPAAAFALDPARPGTIFAATESEGVWRSTDGGASWTPSRDGLSDAATFSVASTAGTIYVGTAKGIDFSSDGGDHWAPTGFSEVAVALAIDPASPGTAYAGTDTGVVRISQDGVNVRIGAGLSGVGALAIHGHRLWAGTIAGSFEHDLRGSRPQNVQR